MRVVDENLLAQFRAKGRCEWCKRASVVNPHHIWARGMGGGGRLDVPANLIALCLSCHEYVHAGMILRCDLLAIVARRENTTQDAITGEIYALRRAPKHPRVRQGELPP